MLQNKLSQMANKPVRRVVGLMSGTSVDGIDAALIEISGTGMQHSVKLVAFENNPFPVDIRSNIFELFNPASSSVDKVGYMNFLLGELYAKAVLSIIRKAGLKPEDVDLIGSHGQTIYHMPHTDNRHGYEIKYTVQIGEGAVIANRTGITCVSDFRVADMAAGGQGAPLVPYTEFLLYRQATKNILLQNIGGIGNITVLKAGCTMEQVFAFDTGPGNMVIDAVVEKITNGRLKMDFGGQLAASGSIDNDLLDRLKNNPYFNLVPPKTTGREYFGEDYVGQVLSYMQEKGISNQDGVATVTYLTAWSIGEAYRRFIQRTCKADQLIIGGGGSYNPVLVDYVRKELEPLGVDTLTQEELGLSSDAKEAIAFAMLADCAIMGQPNNLPNVTGAKMPVIMGKISF